MTDIAPAVATVDLRISKPSMSAFHVRRDKAALFQWVQAPPGDRSSRKRPWCVLSFKAVALLRNKGYRARRLEDGFPEWKMAGLPVS